MAYGLSNGLDDVTLPTDIHEKEVQEVRRNHGRRNHIGAGVSIPTLQRCGGRGGVKIYRIYITRV